VPSSAVVIETPAFKISPATQFAAALQVRREVGPLDRGRRLS
jgi:hypothetical protein